MSKVEPSGRNAQVAIVTGAGGGIGGAIALELADAGFDLLLVDLVTGERLEATADEIRSRGRGCAVHVADIADLANHDRIVAEAISAFGGLDCLVNNAGVSVLARGDVLDVTPESYDRCSDVNARALFFLTQAVARYFLAHPGGDRHRSIVSVTSSSAQMVSTQLAEYCVSKAAAAMAVKVFSARLAAHGIGVYDIQPGVIDTPMIAPSRERYERMAEEGKIAAGRLGRPEEVARVVATLAQGLMPYTVGMTVLVDGGIVMPKS